MSMEAKHKDHLNGAVPVYLLRNGQQRFEHPQQLQILSLLHSATESIRYSAYRTALKFRLLQKRIHFDKIRPTSLALILHRQIAFRSLNHRHTDDPDSPTLSYQDLRSLILDILETAERDSLTSLDPGTTVDLVCSIVFSCFGYPEILHREGEIVIKSIAVIDIPSRKYLSRFVEEVENLLQSADSCDQWQHCSDRPAEFGFTLYCVFKGHLNEEYQVSSLSNDFQNVCGCPHSANFYYDAEKLNLNTYAAFQWQVISLRSHVCKCILRGVFNAFRCGQVGRLAVITFLCCVSGGKLPDRMNLLCHWTASQRPSTEQKWIPRRSLALLLRYVTKMAEFVSEGPAFGSVHVPMALNSCLQQTEGKNDGLSSASLASWILKEPQQLIWISTLYRLQVSEGVSHGSQCSSCGTTPIVGLRYECLRCMKYEACQSCFWQGRVAGSHKNQHPMQEHCRLATRKERTKTFLQKIKCKFAGRLQNYPRQIPEGQPDLSVPGDLKSVLGSESSRSASVTISDEGFGGSEDSDEVASRTVITLSEETGRQVFTKKPSAVRELESILVHLEKGSRDLEHELLRQSNLDGLVTPTVNRRYLGTPQCAAVKITLADQKAQVERLQNLVKAIRTVKPDLEKTESKENQSPIRQSTPLMQSTPLGPPTNHKTLFQRRFGHLQPLDSMSPIGKPMTMDSRLKTPLGVRVENGENENDGTWTVPKTPYRTQSLRAVTSRWSTAIEEVEEIVETETYSSSPTNEQPPPRLTVRGLADLSCRLAPSPSASEPRSPFKSFLSENTKKGFYREPESQLYKELEEIMASVENMFPKDKAPQSLGGRKNSKETAVLNAAAEIGDILADLVETIKNTPT